MSFLKKLETVRKISDIACSFVWQLSRAGSFNREQRDTRRSSIRGVSHPEDEWIGKRGWGWWICGSETRGRLLRVLSRLELCKQTSRELTASARPPDSLLSAFQAVSAVSRGPANSCKEFASRHAIQRSRGRRTGRKRTRAQSAGRKRYLTSAVLALTAPVTASLCLDALTYEYSHVQNTWSLKFLYNWSCDSTDRSFRAQRISKVDKMRSTKSYLVFFAIRRYENGGLG